jgi:hypothetical protein
MGRLSVVVECAKWDEDVEVASLAAVGRSDEANAPVEVFVMRCNP